WTCTTSGAGNLCGAPSGAGNINTTVSLTAGSSATFVFSGTVPPSTAGQLVNTAMVNPPASTIDPNPGNNTGTNENPVSPRADLVVSKTSSPNPYVPGQTLTYTIVVTNNGPSNVTGATVMDNAPAALAGFAWTCSVTGPVNACGAPSGIGSISTTVNLTVGSTATFRLSGTVPAGTTGQLSNSASVTLPAGFVDPVPGNNSASNQNPQTPATTTPTPTPTVVMNLRSLPTPVILVFQSPAAMGIFVSPVRTPTPVISGAASSIPRTAPPAVVITPPNTGDGGLKSRDRGTVRTLINAGITNVIRLRSPPRHHQMMRKRF